LRFLFLNGNQLSGEVPASILNNLGGSANHNFTICPQQGVGFSNYSCP